MKTVHEIVGSLVVIAFIALVIVNLLNVSGKQISWSRQLSYGAAGLLVLQYALGLTLLGNNHHITPWHYLIALAAIIPVGVEHGLAEAREREKPGSGARVAVLATLATAVIVIIAYAIGQSHS